MTTANLWAITTMPTSPSTEWVAEEFDRRAATYDEGRQHVWQAIVPLSCSTRGSGVAGFRRSRHRLLLATTRRDGRPQISPVSGGVDSKGRIVISTYPTRAKTHNAERSPQASVLVLSDDWNGPGCR
jgi:hypothetical protein